MIFKNHSKKEEKIRRKIDSLLGKRSKTKPKKSFKNILLLSSIILLIFVSLFVFSLLAGNLTGFVISDNKEITQSFDNEIDLEIRNPPQLAGQIMSENKNKRMDFQTAGENIRLYFNLLNYSEFVEDIAISGNLMDEKESSEQTGYGEIVDSEESSEASKITGFFVRIFNNILGLTGRVTEPIEDETGYGIDNVRPDEQGLASESSSSLSELNINDIRDAITNLTGKELEEIEKQTEINLENDEFEIEVNETKAEQAGVDYKWGYKVELKDLKFMAKVEITSEKDILVWDNSKIKIENKILSFQDLVDEDYKITIEKPSLEIEIENLTTRRVTEIEENVIIINKSEEEIIEKIKNKTKEKEIISNETKIIVNKTVVIENNQTEIPENKTEDHIVNPMQDPDDQASELGSVEDKKKEKAKKQKDREKDKKEKSEQKQTGYGEKQKKNKGITGNFIKFITGLVIGGEVEDIEYENKVTVYIERDFEEINDNIVSVERLNEETGYGVVNNDIKISYIVQEIVQKETKNTINLTLDHQGGSVSENSSTNQDPSSLNSLQDTNIKNKKENTKNAGGTANNLLTVDYDNYKEHKYLNVSGGNENLINLTQDEQGLASNTNLTPATDTQDSQDLGDNNSEGVYEANLTTTNITKSIIFNDLDNDNKLSVGDIIYLDPAMWTISEFKPSESIDINVTQENNFTHLDISDVSPYDSLVGYWSFDMNHSEFSNVTYDYTDNNNDGSVVNATYNSSGMYGGVMEFDGDGDYVDVSYSQSLNTSSNEVTVSAWVKRNESSCSYSTTWRGIVTRDITDSYGLYWNSGTGCGSTRFSFDVVNNSGFRTSGNEYDPGSIDGEWHHLVGVYNGTNAIIYFDGDEKDNQAMSGSIEDVSNSVWIGFGGSDRYFPGSIDEVMIFNTSLTEAQILDIYNNQSARFKVNGTQELKQFNMSLDNDWLKVSEEEQEYMGSDLQKRVGQWDVDMGYKDWDFGSNTYGEFDGDGDYVSVGDGSFSGNTGTVSMWLMRNGLNTEYILDSYTSSTERYIILFVTGTERIDIYSPNGARTVTTTLPYSTSVWTHIVYIWDNSSEITARLYENGVEVFNSSIDFLGSPTANMWIGSDKNGNNEFNGSIDEVRIYNRSLSASEILEINQSGRVANTSINSTGLVGYWDFDEDEYVGDGMSVRDKSGEGNDGVKYGDVGYSSDWLNSSLVGYWHFDNLSAYGENDTHVYDFSGNGNNGTAINLSDVDSGYRDDAVYGRAMEFDGDGDYVDVGSGVINNLAKFTFSFWYNPASSTQDNYAGILCTGANCYNNFRVSTGGTDGKELAFRSDNDLNILNFQTTNDIFPVNVWSHVAGTWNGTNYTWYVNGVKDTQTGGTIDGVVSSADSLDIGKYATTNFNGSIDEVMIFNRSLSAEQIKQLYIKGRAKFEYTPYQDNDYFEVDSSNTNFLVGYKFNAGNSSNPFYSPLLMTTASNPINITEDVGNPTVDLLTPSNGTTEASFGYYFAANFTDDAQLKNSTLWIWNSSGSVIVNQTSTITGTANVSNISIIFDYDDTYTWNYYVCDDSSNCIWNSANWSLTVDVVVTDYDLSSDDFLTNLTFHNSSLGSNITHLSLSRQHPYYNLVGYWSFDMNHSDFENTTFDYSDSGNDGSVVNAVYNSSGMYGGAMVFDGDGDWVELTDIDIGTNGAEATWGLWFYSKGSETDVLLGKHFYYSLGSIISQNNFIYCNAYNTNHAQDMTAQFNVGAGVRNSWHNIMCIYNGSNVLLYYDGEYKSIGSTNSSGLYQNNNPWRIGDNPASVGLFFNGTIDEVMIFNTSLTAQQILDIYNNQSSRFKVNGTQELKQFNMSLSNDWLKVSESEQEYMGSDLQKRVGQWDVDMGYKDWDFGSNTYGEFDGDGDYVDCGALSSMQSYSNYAVSFWIYINNIEGAFDYVFQLKDNSGNTGNSIWMYPDGDVGCCEPVGGEGYDVWNINSVTTGSWHHVVFMSQEENNGTVYVDGLNKGNMTNLETRFPFNDVIFGGSNRSIDFNGSIDEVRIYNRSLTASEILEINQSGRIANNSINSTGLVGYWDFDEDGYVGDGECYDNETEILTDEGWKLFSELDRNEKVMTLNQETGQEEWQLPKDWQVFDNSKLGGEMYKIETEYWDCDDGLDYIDNLQDERYDGVVSSDDESSSQSKQTSNEGILVSDNNNPQNCVKKTGGLVVSEKHKVFSNKRKEESIGIVMMSEEEKDDSFSLLIDSEFEDKTLHNMNTPLTSEVISQGFVVMGSEDDFINFVVKNLSEDRIFSSSLVNLFFTGRHEVRSVNHFESNFLKNSSTDLYLIGVSSLNLLFISSTCSGLGGSSSTGCQSICSQNSQSSSVTSRVSLYLLDMSCFKSLTTALDKNSMPNDLDLSSCILTDNLGNQDYLSFVVDDFSLQPITEVYSDFNNGKDVWFMGSEGELIEIKNIEKIDYSGMIYDVDVENDIVLVRRKNDDSTTQINIDNVILDKLGGLESSQAKDDNYLSNNLSDINKLAEQCDEVHCEAEEGEGDYLVVWSGNSVADKSGLGNDGVKYGNVSYGSDNLNSSLVGYWHFDNLSSAGENDTLVYDWSGNGNNGTVVGGTDVDSGWTSSGVYNGAQMFDGVGDWVDVGDMDNSLFSSDFAISVWVYHNADNSDFIWGKGTANNVNAELFVRGGSGYEFRIDQDTGADIDTGNAVPITTWQHVVVNRNVSNLSIYVDAVIKDSATNSEDGSSTSSFLIGDSSGSPGVIEWDGLIDEVMIFNRSLSAEQIKQLYVKGRAKFEYKPYQEMDDDYFPVDQTNTNFLVGYKFNAGNNTNPFYSPLLMTTTGSPITIYSNDTIAFCGEALGIAGKTYYLDQNILDNSLTSDCITITAENVTLDCQGYSISSDDAYSGVYSNQFNTTIKNCNISMGTSDGGYGIEFTDSADNSSILHNVLGNQYYGLNFASGSNGPDYCVIYNNTANVSCASCIGIYLYNSNNNNLTDNIGISDSSTGGFVRSDYSNLVNNIWISNSSYGIYIDGSYNNLVNNTGTSSSEEGFFIYTVDYSNLTNNKGESDSDYGFYLENSDYNVLNGSIGISNSNNGVYIRGSQHNTFINTNASGAYGFYIRTSANNTIQDCINISGSTKDVYVLSDAGSTNNTFLNCSYDSESVNGAGNELIRKWWYQSYVNDTDGNDVANAKLYYFNTTGNYNGKFTTNSTGGTGKQSLIEYVNTGGTRTYYNNHTLRAVHNNYLQNVTSYNVSLELNNLIHNFELVNDTVVPLIEFVSPTLANNTATTNRSFELNISITEDNLRELIYNWNGTNTSLYNDSLVLMMNFDNVGALGEYDGFVRDLSGNDNDGIVTGAVVNTSGKYGGAYEFDGDGDYVDLGDKDVWNINNVTISAWIKLNDVSGRRDTIIHNYISANPKDYWGIRMDTNDKLLWHMRDSSGVAKLLWSNMTLNANQWYHVVATRDTSTAKIQLYFDSSFNNETSISGQSDLIEGHNGPTVIGSFAGSIPADSYFNGTIDSVLIFNRSLSADEISQLYMSNLNKYDHTKWALWVNQTKNSTDVLDDAKYTTLASALDFNTLLNMTDIRTLIVDNVNPDISITYPSNNTNWSNIGLNINYTASDSGGGLDSCWYSNDSMSVNVSLANCSTNITNVVWTEGWHNVTVWVNDSAGNENKSSVSFRIDTTIPNITLLTPANSVSSTTNSYNFTFNVSDASVVSNCSLIVDGNTINMLYNVSKEVAVGMYNSSFSIARHTWRVNCTDEANNIGNSSQRIFTVTRAVVEEVVSSGGGGSLAEEVPATVGERRFKVDEESINVRIVLDEIKTREFKLTNLEDYGIDVEISVEELDDLIIINDRVSLEKDEKKTVKFKVISPEELGIRTGKIILSYKDVRKEILISINPQSKETLFDVSVNLAEDKLEKQDNLKTQLNLLPVGEKGIDVTVKYIIKDFKGEIYYEESETFYVDAPISVSKEFAIDRLNHGDYILGVEMSYLGGFASASQLFEVKGKFPIKEVNFIIILAGLVIIIILIILGMTMWKTKRYKRNKKHLKIRKRRR